MKKEETVSPDEQAIKKSDPAKDSTDMAVERTMMAADRSLMAWVRTGLSLISFGFTIYKFLDIQNAQLQALGKSLPEISSPKVVGLVMIGIGILSLVLGIIENITTIKALQLKYRIKRPAYSLYVSGIITLIGIVLFVGITFKLSGIS
jgi:putative membrane protein